MRTLRVLCGACVLMVVAAAPSYALPLKFEMVTDELRKGKAVLQGDLVGAAFDITGILTLTATLPGGGATDDWTSTIRLFSGAGTYSVFEVTGRHISNPPPDPGEASPGPPLIVSGVGTINAFIDLKAVGIGGPDQTTPLVRKDEKLHDNPGHLDRMIATLIDLDNNSNSVLVGAGDEIRLTVDLTHVPEPSVVALLVAGSAGLLGYGWGQRKRVVRDEAQSPRQ